jgi:hypothetical protein
MDVVGDQQVLYGSDCWWTPSVAVGKQLKLIDESWRALTIANAGRFLQA